MSLNPTLVSDNQTLFRKDRHLYALIFKKTLLDLFTGQGLNHLMKKNPFQNSGHIFVNWITFAIFDIFQ